MDTIDDNFCATMQITCKYCGAVYRIRPNDLFKYLPYAYSYTCPYCPATSSIYYRDLSPEFKEILK